MVHLNSMQNFLFYEYPHPILFLTFTRRKEINNGLCDIPSNDRKFDREPSDTEKKNYLKYAACISVLKNYSGGNTVT